MSHLDFEGLADFLLGISAELIYEWVPGGHMEGREYCAGSERGGPGNSFKFNTQTGAWCDFANPDVKGGDAVSLWAFLQGLGQGEAAKELAEKYRFGLEPLKPEKKPRPAPVKEVKIIQPPEEHDLPNMNHLMYGDPSQHWSYRDLKGRVMFYMARYDNRDEKNFSPWCWTKDKNWRQKSWPEPRPLYGLEFLKAAPDKPVLIVEGEKACDAARQIVKEFYLVVTWSHGTNSYTKTDWTPLKGRSVLIWPDADRKIVKTEQEERICGTEIGTVKPYSYQPGPMAGYGIAEILSTIAKEIKVLDVGIESDRVDGWDAADALADGWDFPRLVEWAKPRVTIQKTRSPDEPPTETQRKTLQPQKQLKNIEKSTKSNGQTVATSLDAVLDATVIEKRPEPPVLGTIQHKAIDPEPQTAIGVVNWEDLGLACSGQGNPYTNVDNTVRVLENHPALHDIVWFDEFHKRFFTKWGGGPAREWQDVDTLRLTTYFQKEIGLHKTADDLIYKAIVVYGYRNTKNEPRDWFDSLKWDEKPRIDKFLADCMGCEDTDYTASASKNFWIGMVARIFRPGCQLDNMIVLEGAQGIGKTQALRAIGGNWYTAVHESLQRKDFFMVLHGRLIVEIEELDSFNRADVTRIKQVVSCATDRFRTPYARLAEDHKRMSIFVGSTNEQTYLRDTTGGRRFWPIKCGAISKDRIADDREQLFAEAIHRFKAGENWFVMPTVSTKKEQEERRYVDEWESIVGAYLVGKADATLQEIAANLAISTDKLDAVTQRRISTILRGLNWCKKTVSREGVQVRVWYPAEIPYSGDLPLDTSGPSIPANGAESEPPEDFTEEAD